MAVVTRLAGVTSPRRGQVKPRVMSRREDASSESRRVSPESHPDRHAEVERQSTGILVERAYGGDKAAFAELARRGDAATIDGWFKAFEAEQAMRDMTSKLDELRRLDGLLGRSAATPLPRRKGQV